jgi:hypothetical protein
MPLKQLKSFYSVKHTAPFILLSIQRGSYHYAHVNRRGQVARIQINGHR